MSNNLMQIYSVGKCSDDYYMQIQVPVSFTGPEMGKNRDTHTLLTIRWSWKKLKYISGVTPLKKHNLTFIW